MIKFYYLFITLVIYITFLSQNAIAENNKQINSLVEATLKCQVLYGTKNRTIKDFDLYYQNKGLVKQSSCIRECTEGGTCVSCLNNLLEIGLNIENSECVQPSGLDALKAGISLINNVQLASIVSEADKNVMQYCTYTLEGSFDSFNKKYPDCFK